PVRRLPFVVLAVGLVFALVAEWVGYGWGAPRSWLPDLVAGLALLGSGVVAWQRAPASRVGRLLPVWACAWFAGTLDLLLLSVHRAPIAVACLAFPTGRVQGRLPCVAIAATCACTVPALARSDRLTLALVVLLVVCAAREWLVAVGAE